MPGEENSASQMLGASGPSAAVAVLEKNWDMQMSASTEDYDDEGDEAQGPQPLLATLESGSETPATVSEAAAAAAAAAETAEQEDRRQGEEAAAAAAAAADNNNGSDANNSQRQEEDDDEEEEAEDDEELEQLDEASDDDDADDDDPEGATLEPEIPDRDADEADQEAGGGGWQAGQEAAFGMEALTLLANANASANEKQPPPAAVTISSLESFEVLKFYEILD